MKLRKMLVVSVLLGVMSLVTGCSTIVEGTSQSVTVNTEPTGAECNLSREGSQIGAINQTPGTVTIDKDKDTIEISCNKDGYQEGVGILSSEFENMTFGNILIGGIIGVAIDAGSGAMHKYPSIITMKLIPSQFESEQAKDDFFDKMKADYVKEHAESVEKVSESCSGFNCDSEIEAAENLKNQRLAEIERQREDAEVKN